MYNYQGNANSYGAPPSFGAPFPQNAPGMGAPPGMAAPGTGLPPGMQFNAEQQPIRSNALPPTFQTPTNMPNINFNAPVIRLSTSGPQKQPGSVGFEQNRRDVDQRPHRSGLGLDMNAQRQAVRESMMQLLPPTKEEIIRTIFVSGIVDGIGGDEAIERILRCAGSLRRWIRAIDSDNKACRFGFAEYEDPESLATAVEVLKNIEVPLKHKKSAEVKKEEDSESEDSEKVLLQIHIDDSSYTYLEQWEASHGDQDPIRAQLRLDAAKSNLAQVLADLDSPSGPSLSSDMSNLGDGSNPQATNGDLKEDAEVVTIPLSADDELSDIPAEMRETVTKEIQAFRDRSIRRDLERLKREEEMEASERRRATGLSRTSRLASPPTVASSGPVGGANGIPLGPRDRSMLNAPAGPKGYSESQMPKDYQKGVSFVNGSGINGANTSGLIDREGEDSDASDEEIERRKMSRKEAEQEKLYQDQKRRWLNRERSRTAAVERERNRDKTETAHKENEKEIAAIRLREWDDDVEAGRRVDEYYRDRSLWIRNRLAFRSREAQLDDLDRAAEQREQAREQQDKEQAMGMANDFLDQQAVELAAPTREPQRFKLSLGAAAQKAQQANNTGKRTAAEVEGLLEDEEEADSSSKRTLVPIKFDSAADALGLTEEERAQAVRQLAADIPSDKDGLWKWPVKWEFVDESVLTEQLRPFVEKKIVEYLGVQEQMLVEVVEEHIRKRGEPQPLVGELEGALDEEAEVLVRKLWRMIIFFSESEKRGLST